VRAPRPSASWFVIAAILTGSALLAWYDASIHNAADVYLFAAVGSEMFSGQWLHSFGSQSVQAAPLELALTAIARSFGGGAVGFAIVLDVVCTAAMIALAASLFSRRALGLAVLGLAAFALRIPGAGYAGHPAEPLIAVLWLIAAREARRDRPGRAGVAVGLSACFEVWGILGVTALAVAPRLRRCGPGIALAAGLPVICLLPFALGGDFHMFDMHWTILRGVPKLLFGYGREFTWPLRAAEGAVIVSVGGAAAAVTRRIPESTWIVPAATALARIALDPVLFGYYWDTALVILLIGATGVMVHPDDLRDRLASRLTPGRRVSALRST
jgi:hypothetical protein